MQFNVSFVYAHMVCIEDKDLKTKINVQYLSSTAALYTLYNRIVILWS